MPVNRADGSSFDQCRISIGKRALRFIVADPDWDSEIDETVRAICKRGVFKRGVLLESQALTREVDAAARFKVGFEDNATINDRVTSI